MCAAVLKVPCEEVDRSWDVELVGKEKQKVTSVGCTFWIWFNVYDFYDLHNFLQSLFAGADEELNK